MNRRFKRIAVGFFLVLSLVTYHVNEVSAEEKLRADVTVSKNEVSPGDTLDITVALQNYNTDSVPELTAMKLIVTMDTNFLTYIENSAQDAAGISDKENIYMLYFQNNQVILQFSDPGSPLPRETSNLLTFQVKVKDSLPQKADFDIGLSEAKGEDIHLNKIPIETGSIKLLVAGYKQNNGAENKTSENNLSNTSENKNGNSQNINDESQGLEEPENSQNNPKEGAVNRGSLSQSADGKNAVNEKSEMKEAGEDTTKQSDSDNAEERIPSHKKWIAVAAGILIILVIIGIASKNKIKEFYHAWKKH